MARHMLLGSGLVCFETGSWRGGLKRERGRKSARFRGVWIESCLRFSELFNRIRGLLER
jgi:hypothetical protein